MSISGTFHVARLTGDGEAEADIEHNTCNNVNIDPHVTQFNPQNESKPRPIIL